MSVAPEKGMGFNFSYYDENTYKKYDSRIGVSLHEKNYSITITKIKRKVMFKCDRCMCFATGFKHIFNNGLDRGCNHLLMNIRKQR